MKKYLFLLLFTLFVLCTLTFSAHAATYYVAQNGGATAPASPTVSVDCSREIR